MKVNHKSPKKAEGSVHERDLQRTIDKLKIANETAVRRAAALTVEVEALKKQCAELRAKWEAAHAKVPA